MLRNLEGKPLGKRTFGRRQSRREEDGINMDDSELVKIGGRRDWPRLAYSGRLWCYQCELPGSDNTVFVFWLVQTTDKPR
jgi:hypothetical protein